MLGFTLFLNKWASAANVYSVSVNINSESNIITVRPDRSTRVISESDTVEYKFEFNLSNEEIQEIINLFSTEITNNVIIGEHADYIINTYLIPLIQSSEINSLFIEVLNRLSG